MKKNLLVVLMAGSMMGLASCGGNNNSAPSEADMVRQKEEAKMQAYQDSIDELERVRKEEELKAEEERIEREKTVERAKLERNFPDYTDVVIVTQRSYFHSTPTDESINQKKFLVNGDQTTVIKTKNGFGYVEFYNANRDKLTAGWLDLHDLEALEYGDY
jgi:hypothetical protein